MSDLVFPMPPEPTAPGTILNGHVLTESGWIPLPPNQGSPSAAPVTAMVSGIITAVIGWMPLIGLVSYGLAPLALTFGIIGLRRGQAEHRVMSIIGIVGGALGVFYCVAWMALVVIGAASEPS